MTEFDKLIKVHKQMIESDFENICEYLRTKAVVHDNDKIEEGYVNSVYEEHFPKLKQIEFGTEEYVAYERNHFAKAHYLHSQNRHHYYNPNNELDDIDLFDLIEAIVDMKQSQKQYSQFDMDILLKTFYDKGTLDLDLESLVINTVMRIESLNETND